MKHLIPVIIEQYEALKRNIQLGGEMESEPIDSLPALSEEQAERLADYVGLLISWTKRIDLVSPGSPEQLVHRHILDAFASELMLFLVLPEFVHSGLVDIGSGAGLPGIVLAILQPGRPVYLCEPREKRCIFLSEVKRRLGLQNVRIVSKRVEDLLAADVTQAELLVTRALTPSVAFIEALQVISPERGAIGFFTSPEVKKPEIIPEISDFARIETAQLDYSSVSLVGRRRVYSWKCFT